MVHPGKQEIIYQIIAEELREKYYPGAKLPSERDYALHLGIARRTLRFVLDRLTEERKIIRNAHGTFRCDEQTESHQSIGQKEPLTILLPCPDYMSASGFSAAYAHRQMIQGAMRATIEHGTHVVTIPVSETNLPDEINWLQLRHLCKSSMVMFSNEWFRQICPLLSERKCRVGYFSESRETLFHKNDDISRMEYQNTNTNDFLYSAVKKLHEGGGRRILYFGSSQAVVSQKGKSSFLKACWELNLKSEQVRFHVYSGSMSLPERLMLLGKLYRSLYFDSLILELNPYREHDYEFDLYEETGIPTATKLMISVSDLLHQPRIMEYAEVYHLPVMRFSYEIAKFLLSDQQGCFTRKSQYIFQAAKDFIHETKYK